MRNIFLIFVLMVLFSSGISLFFLSFPYFNLKEIVLSGDADLTLNDVARLSPVFLGTNIFRINTRKMENDIKMDLTLSRVNVKRKLPDKIVIQLQRKKPIFFINLDQLYGLTQKKEIIPLDDFRPGLDLPIVSGLYLKSINFYRKLEIPEIQDAVDFYQAVLETDSTFLDRVSELDFSSAENLILYLLPSGLKVMMGSSDYQRRIVRLVSILKTEGDFDRLCWVDLRFKNQGVVKTKKLQVRKYGS